jgi:hypothetical protein
VEGVVQIKRICGHSSPFTFKKNERFGKERLAKFMSKKCPECTRAEIAAREKAQQDASELRKRIKRRIAARKAAESAGNESPISKMPPAASG